MPEVIAKVYAGELEGIHARLVEVEVDLHAGLHAFHIVGLADKALNEAKERVNSALKNCGVKAPNRENRKITVNLAPADIHKTGSLYDVPIAIGYLKATNQIAPFDATKKLFIGELALDGSIRPVNGALNIAHMAAQKGFEYIFVPQDNAGEAAAIEHIGVIGVSHLKELIELLEEKRPTEKTVYRKPPSPQRTYIDLSEIKGQLHAKRALTIAAAGGHNMLLSGSPGVGKSLLAQAMIGILPPLTREEAIEVTKIYSAAGLNIGKTLLTERPFQAPHHTASVAAIVGGGTTPRPGEISLAHRGILFLDELPEFHKDVLESLRQPMEEGKVYVARAKQKLLFPARFTLIAAMNPCPCGFYADAAQECRCSPYEVVRYQKKISGPLLDRIDLQVKVSRVNVEDLQQKHSGSEESAHVARTVLVARHVQQERFLQQRTPLLLNAQMSSRQVDELVNLAPDTKTFLPKLEAAKLSPRSYYRLLKVAQTIADLEQSKMVQSKHIAEAFSYRLKES